MESTTSQMIRTMSYLGALTENQTSINAGVLL